MNKLGEQLDEQQKTLSYKPFSKVTTRMPMDGYSGPGLQMPQEARIRTSLAEVDNVTGYGNMPRSPLASAE